MTFRLTEKARSDRIARRLQEVHRRGRSAAIADPTIKARLAEPGFTVLHLGSPADFGKFLVEESEKWAKVIKFAGIKGSDRGNGATRKRHKQRNALRFGP